jgi:dienelactone hydrolase
MVSLLLLRTVDRSTRGAMLICVLIVTLAAAAGITQAGTLSPTEQALLKQSSPGAWEARRQYRDIAVDTVGTGETRAYVFRPEARQLSNLPLVLFMHGWRGTNPKNFGGLIDLLVRSGAVVIYPVYQAEGDKTSPQKITANAAQGVRAALDILKQSHPQLIDQEKTLYWGFSMGASIATNFALSHTELGVPAPRAMVLVAPGDAYHVVRGSESAPIVARLESLPTTLPVFLVTGAADTSIGVPTARAWAARVCHLPRSHRTLLLLPSHADSGQQISSAHGSPGAPDSRFDFPDATAPVPGRIAGREGFEASGSLNVLDFYGYWRITMAMFDHVAGGPYPGALFTPGSPENRFLGVWPSGRPYAAAIEEDPCK